MNPPPAPSAVPRPTRDGASIPVSPADALILCALGLGSGVSVLFHGYYQVTAWGPITLLVFAILLGLVLSRPAVPRGPALVACLGLVLFAAWSLLSTSWGESAAQALTEANRWMLYAAALLALLLLVRDDRAARLLVGSTAVPIIGVAVGLLAAMLFADGSSLFRGGRLFEPVGYTNAMAGYLLLGFWPLLAVAEQAKNRLLSAAAIASATVVGALLVLTQSRTVIPAVALAAIVLVAVVPGRRRRFWALLMVAGAVAAVAGPLFDVYQTAGESLPSAGTVRRAASLTTGAAVAAGVVWLLVNWSLAKISSRHPRALDRLNAAGIGAVVTLAVAGLAAVVVTVGSPLEQVREKIDDFRQLRTNKGASRYTSGGGNRYDYWRIAWKQWEDSPIRGEGAGNYTSAYFQERRTTEDVTQPHSLEFEALGSLGLVGFVALALFVAGVLFALGRRAVAARGDPGIRGVVVGSGGLFITWLVYSSGDWLHRIPGLTGMGLVGAAVLLAPWMTRRPLHGGSRVLSATAVSIAVLVIALSSIVVGRSTLAELYAAHGREVIATDARGALRAANNSLKLNDESVPSYYLRAATLAKFGHYRNARATLLEATRKEPHNFLTWALLGDLATRRGDFAEARRYYSRAAELNPRDETVKQLSKDPRPGPEPRP